MYCRVESVLRCPAKVAIACTSQPIRARSVRHRCRVVWVENRGTSASSATRRTTFDQVHMLSGSAWLRRDSDKNSGPLARLITARCRRYSASSAPVGAEYGTARSRRVLVVSARTRSVRWPGSRSSVRSEHSSSRRSAAS
jgi:hypothetical protein